MASHSDVRWPERPYRGLASYSEAEAALFAGRDNELMDCAAKLLRSELSLFLLHGFSGSGKSSFLRAGLIPYLDTLPDSRLEPAKERGPNGQTSLIIRSGDKPLRMLAAAVWELTSAPDEDNGRPTARRREARLTCADKAAFVEAAGTNGESMFRSLEKLALAAPKKLLLIVDQAEDAFVAAPGAESELRQYFELLQLLSNYPLDLKLLISMRSEFKARFDDQLSDNRVDFATVGTYYLDAIAPQGIQEAMLRPTQREPIECNGRILPPPYDTYQFEYQDGLTETISDDLQATTDPASRLPVLQVICDRLYSKLPASNRTITLAHYRLSGASNAQVASHIEEKVVQFFLKTLPEGDVSLAEQADRWKTVLAEMAEQRPGGHVRAKLSIPHSELVTMASSEGCREPTGMIDWLAQRRHYVIEQSSVQAPAGELHWRLVHDSIAAALLQWRDTEVEKRSLVPDDFDPVIQTADFSIAHLYSPSEPQRTTTFHTVNDLIWDHQVALFAQHKGFSERLGLRFDARREFDLTKTQKSMNYEAFLTTPAPDGYRLAVLPSVLFPSVLQEPWTIIGIPNIYRGYAIIGRLPPGLDLVRQPHHGLRESIDQRRHRLSRLAGTLVASDTRTLVFEEYSSRFVACLLDYYGLSNPNIRIVAPDGSRYNSARDPMFTALVKNEADFVAGPAPSRALAEQAGFQLFADFEDVYSVVDDERRQELERLLMHEVWVVDVPRSDRATLLRLAAVMFYTVDYIRRNPADFISFLHNQSLLALNDGGYWLQRRYITQAAARCYEYVSPGDYVFRYLSQLSKAYFKDDDGGAGRLCRDWLAYRGKCDGLLATITSPSRTMWSWDASEAFKRGERHYRIHNYFDAFTHLTRAAELMNLDL